MAGVQESREGKQTVRTIPPYLPRGADSGCVLSLDVFRLKLKGLHRFTSTATAVEDITALQSGKIGKGLKKFLTDEVVGKGKGKESLLVVDPHLGATGFFSLDTWFVLLDSSPLYLEKTQHHRERDDRIPK